LFRRDRAALWRSLASAPDRSALALSHAGREVLRALETRGASFFADLVDDTGLLRTEVEKGLAELAASGLVASDSFAGLRALLVPSERRRPIGGFRRARTAPFGIETAGRWSLVQHIGVEHPDQTAEAVVRQLLARYGVIFRRLLAREALLPPWRDLLRACRRLEARGEIRGGRFVGGFSGEQYALPEAVGTLRAVRREAPTGALVCVSGADPLNLVGIVTPGELVPALTTHRILFRDGIPVAVRAAERGPDRRRERYLVPTTPEEAAVFQRALTRGRMAPLVRTYLGKTARR